MNRACWPASSSGHYFVDIALAGRDFQLAVDTGLLDTFGRVAFEIDPSDYDELKRTLRLRTFETRKRLDSSGRSTLSECGWCDAQLIDPQTRARVGPVVRLQVMRGSPNVTSRVGVLFFHALAGCRVAWDLTARLWCVEYP